MVDELSLQHIRREAVISALQSDKTLAPGLREMALRIAETSGELTAYGCNSAAWPLVDPDRTRKDTDVAHGLKLARRGVELGPEDFRVHDTLAWALFANGKDDEAIAAAEKALELAPDQHKAEHQSYLDRLRRLIEQR